ncbi:phosphodiester glycosidase family protein, partial [Candidatus Latescibacterota bacterium]
MVTVDGRQPGYSVGMSLAELADLMARKLTYFARSRSNAYQAINLDGGGSTTMVVRRQVVNRPSDQTGERPVANALLVVGPAEQVASSR